MSGSPVIAAERGRVSLAAAARMVLELTKAHLSLYIALSAVLGAALAAEGLGVETLVLGAFVWLLSAGAAVLNNIQDRFYDRCFARTRDRSLPRERIGVLPAACLAVTGIAAGIGGLSWFFGWLSGGLGILGLVAYNGLYTPLKKRTLLAILPGILCGMLPPAIGWTAVSTGPVNIRCLAMVMIILGTWQMPHFLILQLKQSDLHRNPYPGFLRRFSRAGLEIRVVIWTWLYSLSLLLFVADGWIISRLFSLVLFTVFLLLPLGMTLAFKARRLNPSLGFGGLNLSMLCFLVLAILDRIPI